MQELDKVIEEINKKYGLDGVSVENYRNCFEINRELYLILIMLDFYQEEIDLKGYNITHYASIFSKNGKKYILDLTYLQFFCDEVYNDDEVKLPNFESYYQTEKEKDVIKKLLQKGRIPYTEENLRIYLKGFQMSLDEGIKL